MPAGIPDKIGGVIRDVPRVKRVIIAGVLNNGSPRDALGVTYSNTMPSTTANSKLRATAWLTPFFMRTILTCCIRMGRTTARSMAVRTLFAIRSTKRVGLDFLHNRKHKIHNTNNHGHVHNLLDQIIVGSKGERLEFIHHNEMFRRCCFCRGVFCCMVTTLCHVGCMIAQKKITRSFVW